MAAESNPGDHELIASLDRVQRLALALGRGIRFDEIGGVSLGDLPEAGRELRVAGEAAVLVPVAARYVILE